MKLHEDEHSVTSISDVVNNIYIGSHERNVKTMIVNSNLTWRIWQMRQCRTFIFGHRTEQQQVHKIKSKCYLNVLHLQKKKDDVAQIEKIPACSENQVSEKALLQFICLQGFDIYPIKSFLQFLSSLEKIKASYSHTRQIFRIKRNSNTSDSYLYYT